MCREPSGLKADRAGDGGDCGRGRSLLYECICLAEVPHGCAEAFFEEFFEVGGVWKSAVGCDLVDGVR